MPGFFRNIDKGIETNFKYPQGDGNMGVMKMDNRCINDKEVLSAVENFEIMLTQLIKRLEKKFKIKRSSPS